MHRKVLAIIKSQKGNYLLLRTNKEWMQTDEWYVVTGGANRKESFNDALIREVTEETQLPIISIKETETTFEYEWPKNSKIMHFEKVFLVTTQEKAPVISEEHLEYKWLPEKDFIEQIYWYGSDKKDLINLLKQF
jgi:8-oxo-dGTP pyrophosphatase MutT (NUDIX family)